MEPKLTDFFSSTLAALLTGLFLMGCAATGADMSRHASGPLIDSTSLEPGLAVLYNEKWYKHVDEMSDRERDLEGWRSGKPILYIDHQFGSGTVFGSGLSRKVGVRMTGYIHLTAPGEWGFKAYANDGIRVIVNGQVVVDDPQLHMGGDRFSKPRTMTVDQAGWYPLLIKYFQKKGTAALSLYWKPPGAAEFSVIPAEAYAHRP